MTKCTKQSPDETGPEGSMNAEAFAHRSVLVSVRACALCARTLRRTGAMTLKRYVRREYRRVGWLFFWHTPLFFARYMQL